MATAAEERRAVLLRGDDNVAVAARPIPKGFVARARRADASRSASRSRWGTRSRWATSPRGEPVRKYGQIIGFASKPIPAGAWVHVHNIKADLFERDYAYASEPPRPPPTAEDPDVPRATSGPTAGSAPGTTSPSSAR